MMAWSPWTATDDMNSSPAGRVVPGRSLAARAQFPALAVVVLAVVMSSPLSNMYADPVAHRSPPGAPMTAAPLALSATAGGVPEPVDGLPVAQDELGSLRTAVAVARRSSLVVIVISKNNVGRPVRVRPDGDRSPGTETPQPKRSLDPVVREELGLPPEQGRGCRRRRCW